MGRGLSDGGENRPLGIPTAAEDFPIVSRVQRVLGWCLWLGIPVVVGVGGTAAFLLTGWPPAAVGVVLVLPVGMIAVVLVLRRYGGNATGWDDQAIRFERSGKPEVVAWDAVEYFRKEAHVQLHVRRTIGLVSAGRLDVQGNVHRPRFSEVRLPTGHE